MSIVRESGGNPFFVAELVRHVQADKSPLELELSLHPKRASSGQRIAGRAKLVLDEVLWSRIRRLPAEARRVLELIAISGRPLRLVELGRCVEQAQDERSSLALLRAGRLIRSTGRAESRRGRDLSRPGPRDRGGPPRAGGVTSASSPAGPGAGGLGAGRSRGPGRAFPGCRPAGTGGRVLRPGRRSGGRGLAFERAATLYRCALELAAGQARTGPGPAGAHWATPWPTPGAGPRRRAPTSRPCAAPRSPRPSSCSAARPCSS